MSDQLFSSQYVSLRAILDELYELKKDPSHTMVRFSKIPGRPPEEPVLLGDLIYSTIRAVSKAGASLRKAGGLSLGNAPMEFKFTGELMGVAPNNEDILLHISLEPRGGKHAG